MSKFSHIRCLKPSDLTKLKVLLDQTELFPTELLEEISHPFFRDSHCTDLWQVYEYSGEPVAFLYCVQEKLTKSTWNVLALAVLPELQRQGIGRLLMNNVEQILQNRNQSTLLVETSSLPEYSRTALLHGELSSLGWHPNGLMNNRCESAGKRT